MRVNASSGCPKSEYCGCRKGQVNVSDMGSLIRKPLCWNRYVVAGRMLYRLVDRKAGAEDRRFLGMAIRSFIGASFSGSSGHQRPGSEDKPSPPLLRVELSLPKSLLQLPRAVRWRLSESVSAPSRQGSI